MKKSVNVRNAWSPGYAQVLQRIQKDKVCPFCAEHFLKYHTKPIITEGRHWILTENFRPYEGARHHLLLVARKHVAHFDELGSAAQAELFDLAGGELKRRGVRGGGLFMRFGDTDYTGGSVGHLHAQVIVGTKRRKDTEPLCVVLGNKKKSTRR